MKKIFYLFICLMLFASCDNVALRKDRTKKVTFNNIAKEGSYEIYLHDLNYPKDQKGKLVFLKNFEKLLKSGTDKNFLISLDLYNDINAIIEDSAVGNEDSFFKLASFIDNNDKIIINRKVGNVRTPKNAGKIQEYLNKQCYYILTLLGREDEYDKNSYYSEFDKEKLILKHLKNRTELKNLLLENKKNFVIKIKDLSELEKTHEKIVYFEAFDEKTLDNIVKNEKNLNSPIVILKNNKYTGYTANQNNLILFAGNGKTKLNSFIGYDFNVKIIESDKVKLLTNVKQLEISALIGRSKYIPKRPLDV